MKLILASNSPRRKDLLEKAGYKFDIIPSFDEENADKNLPPEKYTEQLAFNKAQSVFKKLENTADVVVIGADTIVYLNNEIIGKAKNSAEAECTLKKLSGAVHSVTTGYAIVSATQTFIGHETTLVTFENLPDSVINEYIKSGLWVGKAGSYGIQDGFKLVKKISGDYDNVVGLPTSVIVKILRENYEK